jgi:two-component system, NarL family, sensor kinase
LHKKIRKEAAVQQQFTRQLLENTEDERSRIARDLHDSVSHELLALKREMQGADATKRIDYIINDIRQISRNLHPVMLESIGLKLSLETLCDQYMEQGELFVSHDINYTKRLPGTAELQLFRIVQEAITNTIKYAGADACKVTLLEQNSTLRLTIQDNGRGFDVDQALNSGKSFGLRSIFQRSKAIGGRADIQSSATGTVIRVEVPNA